MFSETSNILGYQIGNQGLASNVAIALNFIESNIKTDTKYMACANPHSLMEAEHDNTFKESLNNADLLLPDGIGIVLAANILNLGVKERVAGNEFFVEVMNSCNRQHNIKIFFLGSTEQVLVRLAERVKKNFPNLVVCGTYSPPFKSEFSDQESQKMIEVINASQPHILWVGMTAPKQEKWIYHNKDKLNVNFIGAIGAVFDFYSGSKKRAPQWICKLGLEWLPRLLREPRRLWKRNFVSTPLFIIAIFKQKLFNLYREQ